MLGLCRITINGVDIHSLAHLPIHLFCLLSIHLFIDSTQLVKNPPAMQETLVQFLGWKDLLKKE